MKLHRASLIKGFLLFLVATIVLTLCYPTNQITFKKRYTLNQPWRYEEVLVAPFDFEVKKSPGSIQAEKAAIEARKVYFFDIDRSVYGQQRMKLSSAFDTNQLPTYFQEHQGAVAVLIQTLEEVYAQGIISDDMRASLGSDSVRLSIRGADHISTERMMYEVRTPSEAVQYIMTVLPSDASTAIAHEERATDIASYVVPNMIYDEKLTEQMLDLEKGMIDEVIGVVRKGEKIVAQGEIVTQEIFQELEGYKEALKNNAMDSTGQLWRKFGIGLLVFIILYTQFTYLATFRPRMISDLKNLIFLLALIVFFVAITYLVVPKFPNAVYVIPYCIVPILIRIFFDSRTAFTTHVLVSVLAAVVVPDPLLFMLIQVAAGRTVVVALKELSQIGDIVRTTLWVLGTMLSVYAAYQLFTTGGVSALFSNTVFYFVVNFVFLMFSFLLVHVQERLFGYVSNIRLVELADINKPLLQRMSEVAPGTFQHSINVSILAAAACSKIGADVQLVRSGALYHDIGKMRNPMYFTENQGPNNPHSRLSYDESARIIIRHVTDGVEMAMANKLPEALIDFIRTHHGLGMTKYFYIKYKNEHPDEVIDESIFHYPGPNPFTKEQGIMMLADSVEASSRSLTELTEEVLKNHVSKIVNGIVEEGLLKNTPLTFRDIEVTKQVFLEKLRTMHHSRIAYPVLNRGSSKE